MNLKFVAKDIQLWSLDQLVPYARNARTHSQPQIVQVAASIAEFGFTNPLLIDSHSGIIAGHCRLEAARMLGLQQVPVVVLDHLSETQKRAYMLADNKLALNAGWDDQMLAVELAALAEDGFDATLTGFEESELAQLAASLKQDLAQLGTDQVGAVPEIPVSRTGDLWRLGPHRVLCGDALSPACLDTVLEGDRAALVFTDPPYNVNYLGGAGATERRPIANDNLGEEFAQFMLKACANLLRVAEGAVYLCTSSSQLHTVQHAFTTAGGHWSTFLIWAKNTFTLGRSDYQRQYEPILYGWKEGAARHWCGDRNQGDVWFIVKPAVNDLHPTMKPVELVERAVRNSSREQDIVLDPFAGAGSTLIACQRLGRRARLIELEPAYVDVIVQRWEALTGGAAILDQHAKSFPDVAAERTGSVAPV